MIEIFGHRSSQNNYVICQYICCALLIGQCYYGSVGAISSGINVNVSTTSSTDINSVLLSSPAGPSTTMASNTDFESMNESNGTIPFHGWQCHCWNTTHMSEVSFFLEN